MKRKPKRILAIEILMLEQRVYLRPFEKFDLASMRIEYNARFGF